MESSFGQLRPNPFSVRAENDYGRRDKNSRLVTDDIESVRTRIVSRPSPEKREQHAHAAICGIDPTNVGCLICRKDSIENENGRSGNPVTKWPSLAELAPHTLTTSDLAQTGKPRASYGSQHRHHCAYGLSERCRLPMIRL
jgi:hypothetical protein